MSQQHGSKRKQVAQREDAKRKKEIKADRDWWKHVIIYQIYPRSFQDSNNDGIGDIRGIISRLDHFDYLNVGAVWISPVYKSPMVDHGYDISDFKDIDPVFGTLEDFDQLVAAAHKRDIRIIMDFIANHSSNQHPWFVESCKGGENNEYKDYYIWMDGKKNASTGSVEPPNNWISVFGGSTWTWVEERQQYFLHMFTPEQPDLNYKNHRVLEEVLDIFKFWLDRGVDGFRMDAVVHLVKHEEYLDEPRSTRVDVPCDHPDYHDHIYTTYHPEVHSIMKKFRKLFDEHEEQTGKYIFMTAEAYDSEFVENVKFYDSGCDMPLNLSLLSVDKNTTGLALRDYVKSWMDAMPAGKWPNFVLGNHDRFRISTRMDPKFVDAMNVFLLLLPGTPTTYYGEEIGMLEIAVSYEDVQDPWAKNLGPEFYATVNRDVCRSPMQWDSTNNAGFSSAERTWLPVHSSYKQLNVEDEMNAGAGSHINLYRSAALLRKMRPFLNAEMEFFAADDNVFSFIRRSSKCNKEEEEEDDDDESYLVALNVGKETSTLQHPAQKLGQGTVVLNTRDPKKCGSSVCAEEVELESGECVVLRF